MVNSNHPKPTVKRQSERILGDATRVITRPHIPENPQRISKIIQRVLDLPEARAEAVLKQVMTDFSDRHKDIRAIFSRHFNEVTGYLSGDIVLSETQKALIGAYFTMEYSIESAALFNPSIVPHPDQSQLPDGCLRIVMSLRATGEGHLSSIVFRSGVLDGNNSLILDAKSDYVETPEVHRDPIYNRNVFHMKLIEMGADNEIMRHLLDQLLDTFSYQGLKRNIEALRTESAFPKESQHRTLEIVAWLANSNYEVFFQHDHLLSERVIFPTSKSESRGIEDARFVQFFNDDGQVTYYATYTAYNGVSILPQLIETKDFLHFKISTPVMIGISISQRIRSGK